MSRVELGAEIKTFGFNEEEWGRSIIACSAMIILGTVGIATGCYELFKSGTFDWASFLLGSLLGPFLVAGGGYLLYQLRPWLMSITIHEHGLQIQERGGTRILIWQDITRIEESVLGRERRQSVRQLMIEGPQGLGLLVNELGIASFDDLCATLRQLAGEYRIEWNDLGG